MSGQKTISTSETRLEAMQFQSSAYGIAIPIVGGVTRLAGNLIYYNDFKAIPTTVTQGGKGGSVKTQNTTFAYQASIIMALCYGQVTGVPRVWKGKTLFADQSGNAAVLATVSEVYAVPAIGGSYVTAHAASFGSNGGVSFTGIFFGALDSGPYTATLSEGIDYIQSNGTYTFPPTSGGVSQTVTITYTYIVAPANLSAMVQLGASLLPGYATQAPPSWVTSLHPSDATAFSGMAVVSAQNYSLGTGAQVDNHTFEVIGPGAYSVGPSVPDIDPAAFVVKILKDGRYGARIPAMYVDAITSWTAYCLANNILISPAITAQLSAAEFLKTVAAITNTGLVWSSGRLKFIPYGDTAASGNGATFTPNVTPVYALGDDVYITSGAEPPVKVTRKPSSQAFNHFRVQYRNRANNYALEIVEAKDQADIEVNGLRSSAIVRADWVCDGVVARNVAQLMLQRSLYVRATFEFALPWNFAFLEPMDLVTLTDSSQGLSGYAVRITQVEERDGDLIFLAEDFALGVAAAATYSTQIGAGFAHDYNAAPGNVLAPFIFEAPIERTLTGLEVYTAVRGTGALWGGCRVWTSLDGVQYKDTGVIYGGARYGALTGPVSGGSLPVALNGGQLLSGSTADSVNLSTLCYVGGANPEYLAYTSANLTGASAYSLTGLTRSAFTTSGAAHLVGEPFARVDSAIAKSGPLDLSMIGKTIYFKFTSVNVYGGGEQSLATVAAYLYIVTGAMAALPPPDVTELTIDGVKLTWPPVVALDLAGYRIKYQYGSNLDWGTANPIQTGLITDSPYVIQVVPPGSITIMIRSVDTTGNESKSSAYVITNLGNSLVANVVESIDFRAASWPGTRYNSSIVSGNVQATQSDPFFRLDAANAFPLDGSPFYSSNYDLMEWDSTPWVPSLAATGSKMTAAWTLTGDAVSVQYRQTGPSPFFGPVSNAFYGDDASAFFTPVGAWLAWPGALTAQNQAYQFRVLTAGGPTTGLLSAFVVSVDVPDKVLKLNAVAILAGGTRLTGAAGQFNAIQNIQLTLQGGSSAVSIEIMDKSSPLGPLINAKNSAGISVAATIDALLQGY